jgi:hypothetical protein
MKKIEKVPEVMDEMPEIDFNTCKILHRGPQRTRYFSLSTLRGAVGLTQAEVAEKANISQSEVSRAEQRSDCLFSTLSRYARALDGELKISISIDGRDYPVSLH